MIDLIIGTVIVLFFLIGMIYSLLWILFYIQGWAYYSFGPFDKRNGWYRPDGAAQYRLPFPVTFWDLTKDEWRRLWAKPGIDQDTVDSNLDTAILENQYDDMMEWPSDEIAIDMLAYCEEAQGSSVEELVPLIDDWKQRRDYE